MCCLNVVNGLCAQYIENGLFGTLVVLCGKLYHKYFYIGKTKRFRDRLRKHITGLLYPHRVRPQPYMSFLTAHAGGYSISALARLTFVPIAQCSGNLDVFELEQHIINTEHPPPSMSRTCPCSLLTLGHLRRCAFIKCASSWWFLPGPPTIWLDLRIKVITGMHVLLGR